MLTEEQKAIVQAVQAGQNVTGQAVPGAGKTHTLLSLEKTLRDLGRRVLCLTYSSPLKSEWRDKSPRQNPTDRWHIHSFHSFTRELYEVPGEVKDEQMRDCLQQPIPTANLPIYNVIIIDEVQDMGQLHLQLLKAYVRLLPTQPQLMLMGDARQCVYKYKSGDLRADSCYLTKPEASLLDLYDTERSWSHLWITKSHRLTKTIAHFVNVFFGLRDREIIRGVNRGEEPVDYWIGDMFKRIAEIAEFIYEKYVKTYGPGHIQFLCQFNPQREDDRTFQTQILNLLNNNHGMPYRNSKEKGVNCAVRYTYAGCKGTEAKCVILLGATLFNHPDLAQRFVACTRASQKLVLFHHCKEEAMGDLEAVRKLGADTVRFFARDALVVKESGSGKRKNLRVAEMCTDELTGTMEAEVDDRLDWTDTTDSTTAGLLSFDEPELVLQDGGATFTPNYAKIYGDAITMMFERRQGLEAPPRLYGRIFDPIIVTRCYEEFANGLIREFHSLRDTTRANACTRLQQSVARLYKAFYRKRKKDSNEARVESERKRAQQELEERLKLPTGHQPTEGEFLELLERWIDQQARDDSTGTNLRELRGRFMGASEYNLLFPEAKRFELLQRVPLEGPWGPSQCAEAACASQAYGGEHHSYMQIGNYDWVDERVMDKAVQRICDSVEPDLNIEEDIIVSFKDPVKGERMLAPRHGLAGRMDAAGADPNVPVVYEFKFHREALTRNDKAQLVIYMHMKAWKEERTHIYGILLNTRTGERLQTELRTTPSDSERFLGRIVRESTGADSPPELCRHGGELSLPPPWL